jgi:hypothetical protein
MNTHWQAVLNEVFLGPHRNYVIPLAYLVSAIVCCCMASSTNLAWSAPHKVSKLLLLLCVLYFLAACNALLHVDTEWIIWARTFAREQHAYELRRPIQSATLLVSVLFLTTGWRAYHSSRSALGIDSLVWVGGCGTLVLHLLRFVSFHYADSALNYLWLNHSIASWIELGSLGLVSAGTGLALLRGNSHIQ